MLYGTTTTFLERLGLPSLAALPALAPLLEPDAGASAVDAAVDDEPAPAAVEDEAAGAG
jgi:hypothetical protein